MFSEINYSWLKLCWPFVPTSLIIGLGKAPHLLLKRAPRCLRLLLLPLRRKQKRLDDFVVLVAQAQTRRMLQERAGSQELLMTGTQARHPASEQFPSEELLRHLATHYNIHLLLEEITVAKSFLARKDKDTIPIIQSIFSLLDGDMFPASSSTCDRSLGALY